MTDMANGSSAHATTDQCLCV